MFKKVERNYVLKEYLEYGLSIIITSKLIVIIYGMTQTKLLNREGILKFRFLIIFFMLMDLAILVFLRAAIWMDTTETIVGE